jgi:ribosomal protein S25
MPSIIITQHVIEGGLRILIQIAKGPIRHAAGQKPKRPHQNQAARETAQRIPTATQEELDRIKNEDQQRRLSYEKEVA